MAGIVSGEPRVNGEVLCTVEFTILEYEDMPSVSGVGVRWLIAITPLELTGLRIGIILFDPCV